MQSIVFSYRVSHIRGRAADGRETEQAYRPAGGFELQMWYCHRQQVFYETSLNQQSRLAFNQVEIFLYIRFGNE